MSIYKVYQTRCNYTLTLPHAGFRLTHFQSHNRREIHVDRDTAAEKLENPLCFAAQGIAGRMIKFRYFRSWLVTNHDSCAFSTIDQVDSSSLK